MKKTITAILFAALCTAASSQERGWTIGECIDRALESNIELRQQALQVESADIDLNTSRNSRLPNLTAGVNQSFNFGRFLSSETNTYESHNSASTGISLSSSIPVFAGFSIGNQIKSNRLNLEAATKGLDRARENLALNVTSYFLEILFKKEILATMHEQLELARKQVSQTEIMVEAGSVPRSQYYDAVAQMERENLNVVTAANDVQMSLLNLAQLLNIDDYGSFDIVAPELEGEIPQADPRLLLSPESVYRTALGLRPQIRQAELMLTGSEYGEKIARSSYWPTLSLGLSYGSGYDHIFDSSFPNKSFGSQFKTNARQGIGLSLNIPIFNNNRTRNEVRKARLSIQDRTLELDNVKRTLFKEIQQAHHSAVASQARYTTAGKAYEAAEQAYSYMWSRYEVGKATAYELNESRVKLAQSSSEQIQAKFEYIFRMRILDFYRGGSLTRW